MNERVAALGVDADLAGRENSAAEQNLENRKRGDGVGRGIMTLEGMRVKGGQR